MSPTNMQSGERLQCEDWCVRPIKDQMPQKRCSRLAARKFTLWPDDPEFSPEVHYYCKEHALRNQREAVESSIEYILSVIPPEDQSLVVLRGAPPGDGNT